MCPRTSKLDCEGDTREALVILIKSHTRRPPLPGRDRRKIRTHRSYMCTVDVRLDRRTFALFHTRVFNFTLLRVFLSYVPLPARCVGHAHLGSALPIRQVSLDITIGIMTAQGDSQGRGSTHTCTDVVRNSSEVCSLGRGRIGLVSVQVSQVDYSTASQRCVDIRSVGQVDQLQAGARTPPMIG